MHIFYDIHEWITFRQTLSKSTTLGFVPTMGHLHAGHESLIARSQQENQQTIVSIFLNPMQFNNKNDYLNYPKTLEADLKRLDAMEVDFCLVPLAEAIYPEGEDFQLEETSLSTLMEGAYRPGHFTGVLTVLMKLFHLVQPQQVYMGEKDYQQYLLVKKMAYAFFMTIKITACRTIREPSGLAYSSRSSRLTPHERIHAERFATIFHQPDLSGIAIMKELKTNHISVEYFEEYEGRRFISVIIGSIRLIDNYALP